MDSLKNGSLVNVGAKAWPSKSWRILAALALLATMMVAVSAQSAMAERGGEKGRTEDVTFTKWASSSPTSPTSLAGVSMAGVVGGAVGEGLFTGQVLRDNTSVPGFWLAKARYGLIGEEHSFTAHVFVAQDSSAGTAKITGLVTQGWMEGALVTGSYQVLDPCPIPTPGNVLGSLCFQGTLHLHRSLGR